MSVHVGITHAARHVPPGRMSAQELAHRAGIAVERVTEGYGLLEKAVGKTGETALDHALLAGRSLLADVDPISIDLLIYTSASMPDYPIWAGVYKLHELLGLRHARFLELHVGCIGSLHALEMAKSYMIANPKIARAMVIGAEGYHYDMAVANYANPANEPTWIFADGAAAVLLETDRTSRLANHLGEFEFLVDSRRYADVPIPGGGAKLPASSASVAAGAHALQMTPTDTRELRRFGVRYIQNYLSVITRALAAIGHEGPPDLLISNQLKRPLQRILESKLGLAHDRTIYTLPTLGHVGTADLLLGIGEALDGQRLSPGVTAVLVASGVSFSWGATTLSCPG